MSKPDRQKASSLRNRRAAVPITPEGYRIYMPPNEGVSLPEPLITRLKRKREVRIRGYLPLRPNEFVSWQRQWPNYTKIVPITISVRRQDLHDLAVADQPAQLPDFFFIPAYEKAGPKPRGANVLAARASRLFLLVAWDLRHELEDNSGLANRVRTYARKLGEDSHLLARRPDGMVREMVAYMMDKRWRAQFEKFGLRCPLDDVDAFAKKYLPRRLPPQIRWHEYHSDALASTIVFFDPDYYSRLLETKPLGILKD